MTGENQEFSSEKVKFENLFRCPVDVIKALDLSGEIRLKIHTFGSCLHINDIQSHVLEGPVKGKT